MTMAEKPGGIRHAEARVSAVADRLAADRTPADRLAVADRMAADIGSGNLNTQMTQEFC
jgi:hypothetical protein